ncbi:hypothetical protein [Granulicoccus sp. GXG6511]|uniref:hypothetical protein n=1 Tax=Granulicoccus sp. GXG6511 TaxID=3381351 RepID=UPI003D7F13AE
MEPGTIALILILALVIAGGCAWFSLRGRWIKEFTDRGWSFQDGVDISAAYGLNSPPFGLGNTRVVKDMVTGEIDGVGFRVLNYHAGRFGGRVAVFRLPRAYPALQVADAAELAAGSGVGTPGIVGRGMSGDLRFGAAFAPIVDPVLDAHPTLPPDAVLTVDGEHLTITRLPDRAEDMEPVLRTGAAVVRAIDRRADRLARFPVPMVPRELSVHRHPEWTFRERDDALLHRVRHTTDGFDHQARRVIFRIDGPLPFVALSHHWKTRHTRTNSKGETRTVILSHNEDLFEITAPAGFLDLSINAWSMRGVIRFEGIRFNQDFKVRSPHPKFAHDVIHPRMMEFLEARRPPAFSIEGGRIRPVVAHGVRNVANTLEFFEQFFARVPSFVWKDLGHPVSPFTRR